MTLLVYGGIWPVGARTYLERAAKAIGRARVQMSVRIGNETDAFEDVIPVEILVSPETVAAYGEASPTAKETISVPAGEPGSLRIRRRFAGQGCR